jgi:hypothetical protein
MPEVFIAFIAILILGTLAFAIAVWFGTLFIAPRIRRALDRAEAGNEESGDRHN